MGSRSLSETSSFTNRHKLQSIYFFLGVPTLAKSYSWADWTRVPTLYQWMYNIPTTTWSRSNIPWDSWMQRWPWGFSVRQAKRGHLPLDSSGLHLLLSTCLISAKIWTLSDSTWIMHWQFSMTSADRCWRRSLLETNLISEKRDKSPGNRRKLCAGIWACITTLRCQLKTTSIPSM